MTFGPIKVFSVGIASAGTSTSMWTFSDGVQAAYIEIPSFASSAEFILQGSTDGVSFRRVMNGIASTATIQTNTFTIASAATARIVPIPICAPFMKVEMTTGPASANTFNIICVY